MKIFDSVFQNLLHQAIRSECGPASSDGIYPPPYLTEREAVQAVVQHQGLVPITFHTFTALFMHQYFSFVLKFKPLLQSIWEAEEQVANLVVLLASNSHWGVSVQDNVIRHPDKTKLQVTNPKIPWECILRNKAFGLLNSLLFVVFGMYHSNDLEYHLECKSIIDHLYPAVGFGAIYVLWRTIQYWLQARQKHQQEVYHYVERIIEYLSSQHQSSGESSFVPVIHVRDQLIAPQSRESELAISHNSFSEVG